MGDEAKFEPPYKIEVVERGGFKVYKAFSCACGEDRHAACDADVAAVKRESEYKYDIATLLVHSLTDEGFGGFEVASDMWAGVFATSERRKVKIEAQCDLVEHGFAAAWRCLQKVIEDTPQCPPEDDEE